MLSDTDSDQRDVPRDGADPREGAQSVDLLVIGGGINGTAIARDAAGRGLSVMLCERDDLAAHTSSASSKMIHGGLRYLEHYDFALVRHALKEREVLLRSAPHIIWPIRLVMPYEPQRRPKWLLRMGLFLYDNIGGRKSLPSSTSRKLDTGPQACILKPHLTSGFEYSDCWVEDTRLVILNAVDAAEKGAQILTRTEVVKIAARGQGFDVTYRSADGVARQVFARGLVNAAGSWVDDVAGLVRPGRNETSVRLVKGSHIVVPRHYAGDQSYVFQNADGRIIFLLPYERDYTLIGTTDVPYSAVEGAPVASDEEITYLCETASEYFDKPIVPDDVVWSYSGVRPLYDDHSSDASEVTRDYVLDLDRTEGGAPCLSVYGGKITTSRLLAEHAMTRLTDSYPQMGRAWTASSPLPGGDIADTDFETFLTEVQDAHPRVAPDFLRKLCRRYGTRVASILAEDTGEMFGNELCESEINYLVQSEWARTGEDVLWRRTKAGLHLSPNRHDSVAFAVTKAVDTMRSQPETGSNARLKPLS